MNSFWIERTIITENCVLIAMVTLLLNSQLLWIDLNHWKPSNFRLMCMLLLGSFISAKWKMDFLSDFILSVSGVVVGVGWSIGDVLLVFVFMFNCMVLEIELVSEMCNIHYILVINKNAHSDGWWICKKSNTQTYVRTAIYVWPLSFAALFTLFVT